MLKYEDYEMVVVTEATCEGCVFNAGEAEEGEGSCSREGGPDCYDGKTGTEYIFIKKEQP